MTAADTVAARYATANARLNSAPCHTLTAMQDAYVAYCRAYGEAYPAEKHLLPDAWKGKRLPEYAAYVVACRAHDIARNGA
jgi:hypothetical protein